MASKPLERKRSAQLELPNTDISTKTSKPARWRIDSNNLRGKLLSESSLDTDKVNRCLSPLVEDSEDGILSQVKIDGSTSNLKHDSKDNRKTSNVQLSQVHSKQNDGKISLEPPSNIDITLKVQSNEVNYPSRMQLKSNSHDDRSPSQLVKPHSNDDRSPPQLKSDSQDDTSPSQLKPHSNDDGSSPKLKLDSHNDRSPSQFKLNSHDDRSPSQLKPHSDNERSPPQLLPHSQDEMSPPQLLKPHPQDDRNPQQLMPPTDNRDPLSFRSYSSIEGQVCPITPAPDVRATTSFGPLDGSDALTSNHNQLKKRFSYRLSQQSNFNSCSLDDEIFSPSVLPPLQSPLLPRITNRGTTSSPYGQQRSREGSLRRYDTSRSLNAQKRQYRKLNSMCSLPEFHVERQHGRLERKMTRQKTASLALEQSMELLATPDKNPGFQSALSSDGYVHER